MARRLALALTVLGLALAACSTPPGTPSTATSSAAAGSDGLSPGPADSAAPATDGSPRPADGTGPTTDDPPAVTLELVVDGLAAPIGVAPTPEGWLLVNEQDGRVVAVDPADARTAGVLDITDRVSGGGERGLLGLALHPAWPDDPRAFIHYSDRNGDTVLSELTGTPGSADAAPALDADSERILLQQDQPYPNHNGGQLAFGPDGLLYLALGDGGSANDPHAHGQNPATLLGSILRLDVSTAGRYSVPDDNPFASGGGGAPEVFLYGLRNPWRFSFDRDTGLLWIADVGQGAFEEVNRVDPATDGGANLGWNVMEGAHCFAAAECSADGLTRPLGEYGHDLGCSVTGGYVYRGEAMPALRGWYLFSDACSGRIFAVSSQADAPEDGVLAPVVVAETGRAVSAFGEGADGELYLVDLAGGGLYRVVVAP